MSNGNDSGLHVSEEHRAKGIALIQEGQKLQAHGHVQEGQAKILEAFDCLEMSLEVYPDNHRSRFALVNCAMSLEKYERAKKEGLTIYDGLSLDQLRQMEDAVLHLSIAHASKMLGQVEDAIQFAKEAAQLYEIDPHPHRFLGEIYESTGRDEEAELECWEALRCTKTDGCKHTLNTQSCYFTQCCLGATLLKQGKNQDAVQILREAALLSETVMDSSALAWRHLCDAYHFQGRWPEALEAARKVAAIAPDDTEIQEKIEILEAQSYPHSARSKRSSRPGSKAGSKKSGSVRSVPEAPRRNHHRDDSGNHVTARSQVSTTSRTSYHSVRVEKKSNDDADEDKLDAPKSGPRESKSGGGFCCCLDR